jgi:Conserved TM helix
MWEQVQHALTESTTQVLDRIAGLIPGLVVLILSLLIAAVVGWILTRILRRALTGIKFDERMARWVGAAPVEWSGAKSPTELAVRAVGWTVLFIGFVIGVSAFDLTLTSALVNRLLQYLPNVVAAVVVLVAGSIIARFLARSVLIGAVNMNLQYARLLSAGTRWMVTVVAVAMALEHLAVGGSIIRLAFGILFGGIVLALALAIGLGSKDLVSRSIEREAGRDALRSEEVMRHL